MKNIFKKITSTLLSTLIVVMGICVFEKSHSHEAQASEHVHTAAEEQHNQTFEGGADHESGSEELAEHCEEESSGFQSDSREETVKKGIFGIHLPGLYSPTKLSSWGDQMLIRSNSPPGAPNPSLAFLSSLRSVLIQV